MTEIGKRIAAARKDRGLSQQALADRLGVAQGCISRWESGDREMRVADLPPLAAALGISPLLLLDPTFDGGYLDAYRSGWDDCARAVTAAARRPEGGNL